MSESVHSIAVSAQDARSILMGQKTMHQQAIILEKTISRRDANFNRWKAVREAPTRAHATDHSQVAHVVVHPKDPRKVVFTMQDGSKKVVKSPFGAANDRLFIREPWRYFGVNSRGDYGGMVTHTDKQKVLYVAGPKVASDFTPPHHQKMMPLRFCRMHATVKSVWIGRLRDQVDDAVAQSLGFNDCDHYRHTMYKVHGGVKGWHDNPYVWRVAFEAARHLVCEHELLKDHLRFEYEKMRGSVPDGVFESEEWVKIPTVNAFLYNREVAHA